MNSDVATITNTVSTLAEYVTTDYSVTGLIGLAQAMIGMDVSNNVYTAAVPTTSVYENDIWWEEVDVSAWEEMMDRVKQGLSPTEETQIDEATGATMSSAGGGGSGNTDSSAGSSSSSRAVLPFLGTYFREGMAVVLLVALTKPLQSFLPMAPLLKQATRMISIIQKPSLCMKIHLRQPRQKKLLACLV